MSDRGPWLPDPAVGLLSVAAASVPVRVEPAGGRGWPVDVGDVVTAFYDGLPCRGRAEAVAPGRAFVRLAVRAPVDWTSPVTGGTVPAGCPRTYLLWMPLTRLRTSRVLRKSGAR